MNFNIIILKKIMESPSWLANFLKSWRSGLIDYEFGALLQRVWFGRLYCTSDKKASYKYVLYSKQKHRLHMVAPSPWPIFSATSALLFVLGLVIWMHGYGTAALFCGTICIISSAFFWLHDVVEEGVFGGYHTYIVTESLRTGFILFLVSEAMLFFAFFWSLLHYSVTPSIFGGGVWPPQGIAIYISLEDFNLVSNYESDWIKAQSPFLKGHDFYVNLLYYDATSIYIPPKLANINFNTPQEVFTLDSSKYLELTDRLDPEDVHIERSEFFINLYSSGVLINPYGIPLVNTAILITSACILTVSHILLRREMHFASYRMLVITVLFGLLFLILQRNEYIWSGFSINDGTYGSIFYLLTGFHGFHVLVGTTFLFVTMLRVRASHFTAHNHLGFEAAAWYWHFVDVIWILLYLLLYVWPSHKFFAGPGYWIYFSTDFTLTINLTMETILSNLNKTAGLDMPTNANLTYTPELKLFLYKDIIAPLLDNNSFYLRAFEQFTLYSQNHEPNFMQWLWTNTLRETVEKMIR